MASKRIVLNTSIQPKKKTIKAINNLQREKKIYEMRMKNEESNKCYVSMCSKAFSVKD